MTVFLLIAAAMVVVALLFVLPPLLRKQGASGSARRDALNLAVLRDQVRELDADLAAGTIDASGHAAARAELERRVAEDVQPDALLAAPSVLPLVSPTLAAPRLRASALVIGLALPLLAGGLYAYLGAPAALDSARLTAANAPQHEVTPEQLVAMVDGLAERLKTRPDDVEGWNMLARSYSTMGRFKEAAAAYAHLAQVAPKDADVLADYADALAMSLGKTMQGQPERLVEQALAADPKHVKALLLFGSASFERHDYRAAAARWQRILALVPPDSEVARSTMGNIAEAQQLAGMPAPAAPRAVAETTPAAASADAGPSANVAAKPASAPRGRSVSGTVELDPALRARVQPGDTVFIFARAANGPRFPLAALRHQAGELPLRFSLDDSMSVVAGSKLSDFTQVVVGARISRSGSATPAVGDLEGLSEPVAPGASGLKIRIQSERK